MKPADFHTATHIMHKASSVALPLSTFGYTAIDANFALDNNWSDESAYASRDGRNRCDLYQDFKEADWFKGFEDRLTKLSRVRNGTRLLARTLLMQGRRRKKPLRIRRPRSKRFERRPWRRESRLRRGSGAASCDSKVFLYIWYHTRCGLPCVLFDASTGSNGDTYRCSQSQK